MKRIEIKIAGRSFPAELNETETARRIYEALPIETSGAFWGDEIYFQVPIALENEAPQAVVEIGDLAYWPPGPALCIFFGPTPASRGNEPRPASPVTVIGKVNARPEEFRELQNLGRIEIRRL
jgi:hypothetical protein